jgi:hypothetical protein
MERVSVSRHKKFDYESAMPEEEVSWRMGSSAGRRLQQRLRKLDLLDADETAASSSEASDT